MSAPDEKPWFDRPASWPRVGVPCRCERCDPETRAYLERTHAEHAARIAAAAVRSPKAAGKADTPTGEAPLCPFCVERMVERKATKDGARFWGCRQFPDCRGRRPA